MLYLNGNPIVMTNFPNKETCFNTCLSDMLEADDINHIIFKYEDNGSLIELMFLKREIEKYVPDGLTYLTIAYMPYSRLDREEGDAAFTLQMIGEYVNWLNFSGVNVIEPHSDVTCGVLKVAHPIDFSVRLFNEAVSSAVIEFNPAVDFICFPDAGAQKRYGKMGDYNTCVGMKDRDFKTGWIKSLQILISGDKSIEGKNVVIIDDLCSKGGTFMLTAKALKDMGAKTVSLVVAHCEETILDGDVLKTDLIDVVVTSNTIINEASVASFDKMFVADFIEIL